MSTTKLALAFGALTLPACLAPPEETLATGDHAIIGGQMASPADYPTVVALEESPGNWFCTGTLIADRWILTAAHCVDGAPAGSVFARFDDADVNDTTGGTAAPIKAVHVHPDFNWEAWDDDIALLELVQPVTDRAPTPIYRDPVVPATAVVDVGYGVADNNDGGGGLLREVHKVTADCAAANDPTVSGDVLVCMDASDGRGSCFGDSGGPTFATVNGALVVAGVTSGGTGDLCGAGWDLYTSIHAELAFLDSVMAGSTPPPPPPEPEEPEPQPEPEPEPDPVTETDDGGCSTGGGHGPLALVGIALALVRRRRA